MKDALPYYIPKLTKSAIGEWRTTCNYLAFNDCIEELLDQKSIDIPFRRRKFDHFLWYSNRKKWYICGFADFYTNADYAQAVAWAIENEITAEQAAATSLPPLPVPVDRLSPSSIALWGSKFRRFFSFWQHVRPEKIPTTFFGKKVVGFFLGRLEALT